MHEGGVTPLQAVLPSLPVVLGTTGVPPLPLLVLLSPSLPSECGFAYVGDAKVPVLSPPPKKGTA